MNFITKITENVGIDKIAHFFAGATIALSVTLILCFVGSISNVILYSIIGTNISVLCGIVKELLDTEFSIEDFLATMFGGIVAVIISLFSLLWTKIAAKNMRKINKIIVHCSATPEGKDVKTETIKDWHVNGNHWKDIGYHYVIELDGSIHKGRDESVIGAHCSGQNADSIGICYVGGVAKDGKTPKDTRTDAQKHSLLELLKELKAKYPNATIHGHREFAAKACPSFDAKSEYKDI